MTTKSPCKHHQSAKMNTGLCGCSVVWAQLEEKMCRSWQGSQNDSGFMLDTRIRFCEAEDKDDLESPTLFLLDWQSHLPASQPATDLLVKTIYWVWSVSVMEYGISKWIFEKKPQEQEEMLSWLLVCTSLRCLAETQQPLVHRRLWVLHQLCVGGLEKS